MSRHERPEREGDGNGAADDEAQATTLELFYDLVFVVAVTQVSHYLLEHLTWTGAGQSTLILLVVWWSWTQTTWVTNELDPESTTVRAVLVVVMLASLLMSVAIPQAFGAHDLLFAASYVAIQIGRHAFLTYGSAHPDTIERERAGRILSWFGVAGVLWIAGAFTDGSVRAAIWIAALAVDYTGPLVFYYVPGRERLEHDAWRIEASHFAERFQLFVIVALGELIVITGTTTSSLDLTLTRGVAFAVAFLGSAALWWLYFNYAATMAERALELTAEPTRVARDAYTYLHVLMIAGIILAAVGDEIVIANPSHQLATAELIVVVAGPVIYLLAQAAFRARVLGTVSWKRLVGAAACAACAAAAPIVPALAVSGLVTGVLAAVIAWEARVQVLRERRGDPGPLEHMEALAEA